jgi:uncharacterized OB-fold protein
MRCSKCRSSVLEPFQYKGQGKVIAFTVVYEAPGNFKGHIPYVAALIKLEEGPVVAALLTDIDINEVRTGMNVQMVTRRLVTHGDKGPIIYAYKFAPKF